MPEAPLRRDCLANVVRDLLLGELATIRGRGKAPAVPGALGLDVSRDDIWRDELGIEAGLGCDSLERLWLSAAANEMFCLYESGAEGNLNAAETLGGWLHAIEEGWKRGVRNVTFSTSGSTGVPKRCTHSFEFLSTEIAYLAELFADRRRVVSLVSSQHIYGFLFTAMLPTHLGIDVVHAGGWSPGTLAATIRPDDLVVATPPRWEWLARSLPKWPAGVRGVSSGGPCSLDVLDSMGRRGVALTEVYGSSETAGVATRTWPAQAYRLMPQWHMPESAGDHPLQIVHASERAFALPDRISVLNAETFTLEGRVDEAVQVGGTNVFPARVADALRTVAGVAQLAVRQGGLGAGGRLKAFVVTDGTPEKEVLIALEETSRRVLTVPERVKDFTFGAELPKGPSGKLVDW